MPGSVLLVLLISLSCCTHSLIHFSPCLVAEERARAVAEAKSHQLAAEHAWQDTEIALANDAAKDATTATQRAQKTHKSLQKALNKIRQSADHRAALLQQQHALETQQLLHAANERARMVCNSVVLFCV
jgi:hypothetical protein